MVVDVDAKEKSSKLGVTVVMLFVLCALQSFLLWDAFLNNVTVSKNQFVCTKIEQVGKNMDDVRCTQYTNQKFSKEAVALNNMVK